MTGPGLERRELAFLSLQDYVYCSNLHTGGLGVRYIQGFLDDREDVLTSDPQDKLQSRQRLQLMTFPVSLSTTYLIIYEG